MTADAGQRPPLSRHASAPLRTMKWHFGIAAIAALLPASTAPAGDCTPADCEPMIPPAAAARSSPTCASRHCAHRLTERPPARRWRLELPRKMHRAGRRPVRLSDGRLHRRAVRATVDVVPGALLILSGRLPGRSVREMPELHPARRRTRRWDPVGGADASGDLLPGGRSLGHPMHIGRRRACPRQHRHYPSLCFVLDVHDQGAAGQPKHRRSPRALYQQALTRHRGARAGRDRRGQRHEPRFILRAEDPTGRARERNPVRARLHGLRVLPLGSRGQATDLPVDGVRRLGRVPAGDGLQLEFEDICCCCCGGGHCGRVAAVSPRCRRCGPLCHAQMTRAGLPAVPVLRLDQSRRTVLGSRAFLK